MHRRTVLQQELYFLARARAIKRLELAEEKKEMTVNHVGAEETVASSDDILTGMFYVYW